MVNTQRLNSGSGASPLPLDNPLSPGETGYARMKTGEITHRSLARSSSNTASLAYTLNFIFGAGVLGIPYAVAHAGIVASSFTMLFFAWLSAVSMVWLTEVCGRGEAVQSWNEMLDRQRRRDGGRVAGLEGGPSAAAAKARPGQGLETSLLASAADGAGATDPAELELADLQLAASIPTFNVTRRRMEINELSTLFCGKGAGIYYGTSLTLYSLASLWFYAVIFALSLTNALPFVPGSYKEGHWVSGSICDFDGLGLSGVSAACRLQ